MRMLRTLVTTGVLCYCLLGAMLARAASPETLREVTVDEIAKIRRAMPDTSVVLPAKPRKMLVFWRCEGFYHGVIPVANKALEIMGQKTGAFEVTTVTDDYSVFTAEKLKAYDVVCLNNTTGLKFDPEKTPDRCRALMDFVKQGKGLVGIHAAADNFNDWPAGREMMGNSFTGHPWGGGGTWSIKIDEPFHDLTTPFKGQSFKIKDEIYRTDAPLYTRDRQFVLMSLDMSDPTTANANGVKPSDKDTGITWIKELGMGRVFYCSLGHNNLVFWHNAILQHYLRGIQFAAGDFNVETQP
jgi:type 1 glutamine amidotransferase